MAYKKISDLDKKLLKVLQEDGRKSYTELAEMFEANVSTVSNRVQKLIDDDILKIVGVVNPYKTSNPFVVDLKVKVKLDKLQSVIEKLSEMDEVRFIASTTGEYNLLFEVYSPSSQVFYEMMNKKFSEIDGIENIKTSVLLKIHKQSYNYTI